MFVTQNEIDMPETSKQKRALSQPAQVVGQCLCGAVRFEIDAPARWAWHDHTRATRTAHGAAYATYVGSWRKRFRVTDGADGGSLATAQGDTQCARVLQALRHAAHL